MRIYNSLSRKKETVRIPRKHPLRMFVCGPTVYDLSHLGHARTFITFDSFVRFLRSRDINVTYLQNITDVDDKIIARAKEKDVAPKELARKFEASYLKDMSDLNVASVDVYARASDFIPRIVEQATTLLQKGYAYEIPGDGYYFDISKFGEYGKLSGRTALAAEDSVSRIDESVKKRHKGDFCLWKFSKPGEPVWKTSLGAGRPGWHIEDTAITETFFGPQYEIHGGALDLKFPHHEAEIAQQEAASGKKPFVKIWMHAGSLEVKGAKMSKSLKNFTTIRDFLDGFSSREYGAEILRMFVLSSHYRSPLDFTPETSGNASRSYETLEEFLMKLSFVAEESKKKKSVPVSRGLKQRERKFFSSLEDDFNTPEALAALYGIASSYERNLWNMGREDASLLESRFRYLMESLGFKPGSYEAPPDRIRKKLEKRELYRGNKQFTHADALRREIHGLGYVIEDTPLGPFARKSRT